MKNPRNYISYSQMVSYERGDYYDNYILGHRRESKEMDFGSRIAKGLQNGSKDKDVEFCRIWLPEPAEREKELTETIEGIRILAKLDGWTEKVLTIDEIKTGKIKWTQQRADQSDQLTLYSMVVWHKFNKDPMARLFWIPTKEMDGEIMLTGELPRLFETKRKIIDYAKMVARLKRAWVGIQKLYSEIKVEETKKKQKNGK